MVMDQVEDQYARHDIVPAHLVVKAMRDNGYKNAAYAIAELMDNSIQAGATQVELLCAEEQVQLQHRTRTRLSKIAVLDNGLGMDRATLRMALQFGNGTHLDAENQDGIGRFGMGLPNSSISQCQRVDVWSWTDGVENSMHTYIDLSEIGAGRMSEVPEPTHKSIPELWNKVGGAIGDSGTLVVWSNIDRCIWRTAQSVIKHSELVIGRMYRRFLNDDRVQIKFVAFDKDRDLDNPSVSWARSNDPLYLMEDTSCPEPFEKEPMFKLWGEKFFDIDFEDRVSRVTIRFSYAREEARLGHRNPGSLPYGKHAAKNLGVSIMRADRELELDASWTDPSDPRDRWWGVEIDFPPALDELFGVTNNKQSARNFSDLAKKDIDSLIEEDMEYFTEIEQLTIDEEPMLPLFQMAEHIRKNISSMRDLLKAQRATSSRTSENERHSIVEQRATEVVNRRKEEGFRGQSDHQEELTREERIEAIEGVLVSEGVAETTARELAARTVDTNLKFTFADADFNSPAFFDVMSRGGAMVLSLNINHPAHAHLVEILEKDTDSIDRDELEERLIKARQGLELLLMAWARLEDETPDGPQKQRAMEARWNWGKMAQEFLRDS